MVARLALEFAAAPGRHLTMAAANRTANFLPGFPAHPQSVVVFGAMLNLQMR